MVVCVELVNIYRLACTASSKPEGNLSQTAYLLHNHR